MAEVARLAGSLLVLTEGRALLVGLPKEPCAYHEHGLSAPPSPESWRGFVTAVEVLEPARLTLAGAVLELPLEGDALAALLAQRLLIARNGSLSERLWRLVTETDPASEPAGRQRARWLVEVPEPVWGAVRDAVLRCS